MIGGGQAQLPEGMRHDLDRIVGSARHMAELIDGLLEFSRLSRGAASFQRIPMRSLVQVVVAEARLPIGTKSRWWSMTCPEVYGDPDMMRQVWST